MMLNPKEYFQALLSKYLNGDSTEEETAFLEKFYDLFDDVDSSDVDSEKGSEIGKSIKEKVDTRIDRENI